MGFLESYNRLQDAFDDGRGEDARVRDVLKYPPGVGAPAELIIGKKLERSTLVTLPETLGGLTVSVICKVLQPSVELCAGAVPLEHFNPMDSQPDPTMVINQRLVWQKSGGTHRARFASSFYPAVLRRLDSSDDKPLVYRMINELPGQPSVHTVAQYSAPGGGEHQAAVAATSHTLPEALGHVIGLNVYGDGTGVFKPQTADQFEEHVTWLLSEDD